MKIITLLTALFLFTSLGFTQDGDTDCVESDSIIVEMKVDQLDFDRMNFVITNNYSTSRLVRITSYTSEEREWEEVMKPYQSLYYRLEKGDQMYVCEVID